MQWSVVGGRWSVIGEVRVPHRSFRAAIIVIMVLMLTACAAREVRDPGDWLGERERLFAQSPVWAVNGRIALSDGNRGGSLSFDWQADGDHHRVGLRTGAGGKNWRLEFGPGYALLEGTDVAQLIDTTPDLIVEHAVGWPIPVTLLTEWIRGLPAPADAQLRFNADGTLAGLDHRSWQLDYARYRTYDSQGGPVLLPQRMEAISGPYRVRVAVGAWEIP